MSGRIFITAAEVSGDRHAAQLIRALHALDPTLEIEGFGGPEMAAVGATLHRNTVIKAAMGWRGILRAGEVYRLLRWTRRHFEKQRPDLWIGVDSPSMNFHFARIAHDRQIPTLQFVAPQLWAWAIWRMKKLRAWVDRVACILPFEEPFFREHGVDAVFIGHPLFDELPPRRTIARSERFPHRPPVVGLLAGSRKSEAEGNFPMMLGVARQIAGAFPDVQFVVPTTPATHPVVKHCLGTAKDGGDVESGGLKVRFAVNAFDDMTPTCDLCLTVSGTATLHVAAFGIPLVVVYYISRWTWRLVGQWLVPTRTFALVNVLAQKQGLTAGHLAPEIVPWTEEQPLADAALDLLRHPQKLEAQREDLARLTAPLDHPGASENVARMALEMMKPAAAPPVA